MACSDVSPCIVVQLVNTLSYLYAAGLSSLALALAAGPPDGHPEDPVHRLRLDRATRGR